MSDAQQSKTPLEKPADAYGQPISAERQEELQGYLDRWATETDHGKRRGPFDKQPGDLLGVRLTGADVFWLAARVRDSDSDASNLHLEGANLIHGQLEGARLASAHLEGADLIEAHLEGADLNQAHLEGADLYEAHLEKSNLLLAHIEGASLHKIHLEGANLRNVWMDKVTALNGALLDRAFLEQMSFGGTNLAVVKWDVIKKLGDEAQAYTRKDGDGKRKDRQTRLDDFERAVRAHLQLAAQLRAQGMSEQADRFAYRAQKLQRTRYRLQRRPGPWLFSWVLFLLAGYGYRPARSLFWYLAIIGIFTGLYMQFGHIGGQPFQFDEALVFSVTSFHGRGFFPGGLELRDLITKFAAAEAVLGLFIEISFIATFTQRYFGAR